jgi:hypothetical protein
LSRGGGSLLYGSSRVISISRVAPNCASIPVGILNLAKDPGMHK